MITTNGVTGSQNYYSSMVQKQNRKDDKVKSTESGSGQPVKSSESKLSDKAKEYLDKLRKDYGDYDFMVADDGDDKRALAGQSNKEFSVLFSSAELERMAEDETYAKEKLDQVDMAVKMSQRINEKFGFTSDGENEAGDTGINKIAVAFNDDGSMTIFAELEKSSAKQKELAEKAKEKRAEEKKAQGERTAEKADKKNPYDKKDESVKRVTIEANSEEELMEKIGEIDWDKVKLEQVYPGRRFSAAI